MEDVNLEEENDVLEYVYNNLDAIVSSLKNLPSEKYNFLELQCQEILNDLDYLMAENQEKLETLDKQQLLELHLKKSY